MHATRRWEGRRRVQACVTIQAALMVHHLARTDEAWALAGVLLALVGTTQSMENADQIPGDAVWLKERLPIVPIAAIR